MTLLRKTLALSAAFAVAVSLFGAFATSASAQSVPFTAYGTGATEGDSIGVWAGTTQCGDAVTADASGNWGPIQIADSLGDCTFANGDTISFSLNGAVADQTETYSLGGRPADAATGTVLTATGGGETPAPVPVPGDTGNAGFASTSTSSIAALLLAAMAAVAIVGGRAVTRSR
ncbi:MAG: hypothetical protein O3A10_05680 [Chloroflexi bacterium]|nr:hypothetical protein [Chloroflexota bacterium]MDA1146167.1 hypothetical protein [Chloroflexota bacterium]